MAFVQGTSITLQIDSTFVVTATAAAAAGAVSITVAPLADPIAAGTVLTFTGGKTATLSAAAAAGATTISVTALATALVGTETATTAGPFLDINGMDTYSRKSGRTSNKKSIFMRATQVKSSGPLDETINMAGLFDPADPGQLRVLSLKSSNTQFNVKITFDGTNGYSQLVQCGNGDTDFKPDDYGNISFVFEGEDNAVIVGTGPIA